uniref:Integrase, catalytic core n=1 Tax=Tanacetum cinerariifolium TaxID=118510 RepID=A0A699GT47_TANCI|nr:integrase, catalytic core [Tanacetum cinerariifolium]
MVIKEKSCDPGIVSLWHDRLGHPRSTMMKRIVETTHGHPLKDQKILQMDNMAPCTSCSHGKLIARPLPLKVEKVSLVFLERIQGDIYGLIHPPCGPFRYFMVLIDALSRWSHVSLLSTRNVAFAKFFAQIIKLRAHFPDYTIKFVRLDNVAVNAPVWVEIPDVKSDDKVTQESKACLKHGRLVGSKDKNHRKGKGTENAIIHDDIVLEGTQNVAPPKEEIDDINKEVFGRIVLTPGVVKLIGYKLVFIRKRNENGKVIRYKSRLVTQGFSQRPGIEYEETYSPVMDAITFRYLISLAVYENLDTRLMDVVTTYLYGSLDSDIYMKTPKGFKIPKALSVKPKYMYSVKLQRSFVLVKVVWTHVPYFSPTPIISSFHIISYMSSPFLSIAILSPFFPLSFTPLIYQDQAMRTVYGNSDYDNQANLISFQFFNGLCIRLIWCVDKLERRPVLQVFRWYKDMKFRKISPFVREKLLELYLWMLAVFVKPHYSEEFEVPYIAIYRKEECQSMFKDQEQGDMENLYDFNQNPTLRWHKEAYIKDALCPPKPRK